MFVAVVLVQSNPGKTGTIVPDGIPKYYRDIVDITKENEEAVIESRHEAQRLFEKQFMYYTIRPWYHCIVQFSHTLCSKKKRRKLPQQ